MRSLPTSEEPRFRCPDCCDTGKVACSIERAGIFYKGVKDCGCKLASLRQIRLAKIPPIFKDVDLQTLKPKTKQQEEAIRLMKENPQKSFMFCGKFGCGKTHLLWTLYKAAAQRDVPRMVACKMVTMIEEYKKHIADSMAKVSPPFLPRLAADDLRQSHTRYSIFFDDIDKDTPTEYVAKQIFDLADAIYENNHQIVTTTNLRVNELVKYFDRADERFGGGIVRRFISDAHIVEMF